MLVWRGHFCPRCIGKGSRARVPAPHRRIWLSASQGLRGSNRCVVWRMEADLVALETCPAGSEKRDVASYVSTIKTKLLEK